MEEFQSDYERGVTRMFQSSPALQDVNADIHQAAQNTRDARERSLNDAAIAKALAVPLPRAVTAREEKQDACMDMEEDADDGGAEEPFTEPEIQAAWVLWQQGFRQLQRMTLDRFMDTSWADLTRAPSFRRGTIDEDGGPLFRRLTWDQSGSLLDFRSAVKEARRASSSAAFTSA